MSAGGPRLVDHFDPRANGLNLLRLLLAASVIFWHTYAVQGVDFGDSPWRQLVGSVGVDGFFAVSGFLILMSYHRDPEPRRYLAARCLRILPAFYVVLVVTVLIFAPVGGRAGRQRVGRTGRPGVLRVHLAEPIPVDLRPRRRRHADRCAVCRQLERLAVDPRVGVRLLPRRAGARRCRSGRTALGHRGHLRARRVGIGGRRLRAH